MAEYGDGAFRSGERLTADKLNSLAAGRPLSVTGAGHADRGSGGDVVAIDQAEVIYIRLTGKDTTKTPIRYAWKEVARNGASSLPGDPTWQNINYRVGSSNGDYATELNNANLTVNDNYIYRSERSPTTGEWLFFFESPSQGSLRRNRILSQASNRDELQYSVLLYQHSQRAVSCVHARPY